MKEQPASNWLLQQFTAIHTIENKMLAATLSGEVFVKEQLDEKWVARQGGLPEGTKINRISSHGDRVFACTGHGMYEYWDERWHLAGPKLPSYQYRRAGGVSHIGTENGVWYSIGFKWKPFACEGRVIYDFMYLPHCYLFAHDKGISLYDRFVDEWIHYDLSCRITSLAIYHGHIVAVSDTGELYTGTRKGEFQRARFPHLFLFSLKTKGDTVYVCTDRGLYKLAVIASQITLISLNFGLAVTDVDMSGDQLYMATLFDGIQQMDTMVASR